MGKRGYYWRWLCIAFRRSIRVGDGIAFLIGIIAPIILRFIPNLESVMNELYWQIPLGAFSAVILARLFLAPYWMDKSRIRERDELLSVTSKNGVVVLETPPTLFIEIVDNEFGLSGDSGYPLPNAEKHKVRWIRLGLSFKGNVFIETLELVFSGKDPILAFEWKPGGVAYYHYFRIPDWVKHGEQRTIQVRAFANGVIWGSPEKSINFPPL